MLLPYCRKNETLRLFSTSARNQTIFMLYVMAVFGLVSALPGSALFAQSDQDSPSQEMLSKFDSKMVDDLIVFAKKVEAWKKELQSVKQIQQQLADGKPLTPDQVDKVFKIAETFAKEVDANARLAEWIEKEERLATIMKEAEEKWKNAPFRPGEHENMTEAAFRKKLKQKAETEAVKLIVEHFDKELLAQVKKLYSAAHHIRGYLDGEFKKWTKEAKAYQKGSLTFRILAPADNVSIFDPKANIGIEIEYVPEAIVVQAKGLYFRYKTPLPEPVLDDLKIDAKSAALANATKKLMTLGNKQLERLSQGTGFTVTIDKLPQFGKGGNQYIEFSATFDSKLLGAGAATPITAKVSQLRLYPVNRVDVSKAKLRLTGRLTPPIPLGNTPLGIWEIGGSYNFKTNGIEAETAISTMATPTEIVGIFASVETAPPYRVFTFKGQLAAANKQLVFCSLDKGTIDFDKGRISAKFTQGGKILGKLFLQEGDFEMTTEQAVMSGKVKIFGQTCSKMRMCLNFKDQSATLDAEQGLELFGADFSNTLSGRLHPGFKKITLSAEKSLKVKVKPWGKISCRVYVEVDSSHKDPVKVETCVLGVPVRFRVGSLHACTMDRLAKEVGKQALSGYMNVYNTLKKGEKDVREWGKEFDRKTARYVSDMAKRNGMDELNTGIDPVDKMLGKGSKFLKQTGGTLHVYNKRLSNAWNHFWDGTWKSLWK